MNDDIHLFIPEQAPFIKIRRADNADAVIYNESFDVIKTLIIPIDEAAGLQKLGIISKSCFPNERVV